MSTSDDFDDILRASDLTPPEESEDIVEVLRRSAADVADDPSIKNARYLGEQVLLRRMFMVDADPALLNACLQIAMFTGGDVPAEFQVDDPSWTAALEAVEQLAARIESGGYERR